MELKHVLRSESQKDTGALEHIVSNFDHVMLIYKKENLF